MYSMILFILSQNLRHLKWRLLTSSLRFLCHYNLKQKKNILYKKFHDYGLKSEKMQFMEYFSPFLAQCIKWGISFS